jgi:hypothetical protein
MFKRPHDAVVVSPAATLEHILWFSALRALVGMVAVLWIVGIGAIPVVLPGLAATITCARAGWSLDPKLARLGLCLSGSMWVGAAVAVLTQGPSGHEAFLAAGIAAFAVTDVMLSTMRMERLS